MTDEKLERIAMRFHNLGANGDAWEKQPAHYRRNVRRMVRNMIAAIEAENGHDD